MSYYVIKCIAIVACLIKQRNTMTSHFRSQLPSSLTFPYTTYVKMNRLPPLQPEGASFHSRTANTSLLIHECSPIGGKCLFHRKLKPTPLHENRKVSILSKTNLHTIERFHLSIHKMDCMSVRRIWHHTYIRVFLTHSFVLFRKNQHWFLDHFQLTRHHARSECIVPSDHDQTDWIRVPRINVHA